MSRFDYGVAFCGGGPATLGALVCAAQDEVLDDLLDVGVLVLEAARLGPGSLGSYQVRANSLGAVFLECLERLPAEAFSTVRGSPAALRLHHWQDDHPPLELVGSLLAELGSVFEGIVNAHPACDVVLGATVERLDLIANGGVAVTWRGQTTAGAFATTRRVGRVVIAMGGERRSDACDLELCAGLSIRPYRDKVWHTSALLDRRAGLPEEVVARVRAGGSVVVVGGSHSAWSAAWLLAEVAGEVTVLHRRPVRLFYMTGEDATADGYTYHPVADVCPLTGRVNRYAGLRGDARELARGALGLTAPCGAVRALQLFPGTTGLRDEVAALLDGADAVLVGNGYRAVLPLLVSSTGEPVEAAVSETGTIVDERARLIGRDGRPIPDVFAYGLGAGLPPSTPLGGEASSTKALDGVWLYQNPVGRVVLQSVLPCVRRPAD